MSRSPRAPLALAVALAVTASAGLSRAQAQPTTPPPTPALTPEESNLSPADRDRRARDQYTQGRAAFDRGDYDTAAARFEEAYRLSGRPELLFNLGSTYDRLHRWPEARDNFRRFLELRPQAAEAENIGPRLQVIERTIERDHERERALAAEAARARSLEEQARRETTPRVVEREVFTPHPARTAGIVLGGGTVVAFAAAGVIWGVGVDRYNYYVNQCRQGLPTCGAADTDLPPRAAFTTAMIITGSVLAAGTAASFLLDAFLPRRRVVLTSARRTPGPSLAVSPGDEPTLLLRGSF